MNESSILERWDRAIAQIVNDDGITDTDVAQGMRDAVAESHGTPTDALISVTASIPTKDGERTTGYLIALRLLQSEIDRELGGGE